MYQAPELPLTKGSITLASSEFKSLVLRVLATRYPCAATALIRFDPYDRVRSNDASYVLAGIPTRHTVDLIAAGANAQEIEQSTTYIWAGPYRTSGGLFLKLSVRTRPEGPDRMVSTIRSEIVDGGESSLSPVLLLEPAIQFQWSRRDQILLSIYTTSI
jgi:hypothetical protein